MILREEGLFKGDLLGLLLYYFLKDIHDQLISCRVLKAFNASPLIRDSLAISNPSLGEMSLTVAMAIPALAQTTLFCASVPFP